MAGSFILAVGFDRADGVTLLPVQPTGASGGGQTLGTPTPTDYLFILSNNDQSQITQELSDSPEIERAEQATFQHTFTTSWLNCLSLIALLSRGTFVTDSFGNIWRILSSSIKHGKGTWGQLSITAESISFDSPPDEFEVVPVELGLDIIKHPRYSWAILPYITDESTYYSVGDTAKIYFSDIKSTIVRMIQMYRDSPYYPSTDYVNGLIHDNIGIQLTTGSLTTTVPNPNYVPAASNTSVQAAPVTWDGNAASLANIATNVQNLTVTLPPGTINVTNADDPIAIALAAAREIISKLWRMEDTPYIVGYQITWAQYFFAPVYLNPGGYAETPIGIVPDYFVSPPGPGELYTTLPRGTESGGYAPDGDLSKNNMDTAPSSTNIATVFDQFVQINPQSYSSDGTTGGNLVISWLRKADEEDYQRTWFRIPRIWLGAPVGKWDSDLYHAFGVNGPQNANDFNQNPQPSGSRQGA